MASTALRFSVPLLDRILQAGLVGALTVVLVGAPFWYFESRRRRRRATAVESWLALKRELILLESAPPPDPPRIAEIRAKILALEASNPGSWFDSAAKLLSEAHRERSVNSL